MKVIKKRRITEVSVEMPVKVTIIQNDDGLTTYKIFFDDKLHFAVHEMDVKIPKFNFNGYIYDLIETAMQEFKDV